MIFHSLTFVQMWRNFGWNCIEELQPSILHFGSQSWEKYKSDGRTNVTTVSGLLYMEFVPGLDGQPQLEKVS